MLFPFPRDKDGFLFTELHRDTVGGAGTVAAMRFSFLIRRGDTDQYALLYNDNTGLYHLPERLCDLKQAPLMLSQIYTLAEHLSGFTALRAEPLAYILDESRDRDKLTVLPYLYIVAEVDEDKPLRPTLPDACELLWCSLAQLEQEVESSIFCGEHPDVLAIRALRQNKIFPVVENWR